MPDARVRVAAIDGLAKLKHDDADREHSPRGLDQSQRSLRRTHNALRGLVAWKVKDADELLATGLEIPANHHSIAATALELSLETPGAKSRELAALYSKYGQPDSLRSTAIGAFSRLAKDDPSLQDILVELADDNDRSVRLQAWNAVRDLKVKKALPVLEARLARESADFGGNYPRKFSKRPSRRSRRHPTNQRKTTPPADSRTGRAPSPTSSARPPNSRKRPKS